MTINQRLDLRQSQSLVMTPQLQQAIKLLQLSNLELADYIETEVERNPLLEREETVDERARADEPVASEEGEVRADAATDDGENDGMDSGEGPADFADYGETSAFSLGSSSRRRRQCRRRGNAILRYRRPRGDAARSFDGPTQRRDRRSC